MVMVVAEVRLARKRSTEEYVVLKKFHTPMSDLNEKERLEIAQEIKLLAHMSHEGIVKFIDNFVEDGTMHIVMEYATGGTLHKHITDREGELIEEARVWEWFVQIVAALKYVHSCNVLHRDLKTQNILLSGPQQRIVKLADFGIARVLGSGREMAATVVGTPHYLSPELCQGQAYDHKSDIWALGCVLYEMAALRKPFDASNMPAIIFAIMRNKPLPIPAGYSDDLRRTIALLLQPSPADRPSITEVEKLPIVEEHYQRWRATRRRLLAPLPTPSGTGGSAAGGNQSSSLAEIETSGGPNSPRDMPSTDMMVVPPTPSHVRQQRRREAAAVEEQVTKELKELRAAAEAASKEDAQNALLKRLSELDAQLRNGPSVSGQVWEALGRAWAENGSFDEAISAYRAAIRSRNANASLGAMEQLGNLLVRRAQQVWAMARAGDVEAAVEAGNRALAGSRSAALMSKTKGGKIGKRRRRNSLSRRRAPSRAPARDSVEGGDGKKDDDARDWRRVAAALMIEGLGLLERLCLLGATVERRCLLGSAYKRRAWTGLGESRKGDLQNAASAYEEAHEIELQNEGHGSGDSDALSEEDSDEESDDTDEDDEEDEFGRSVSGKQKKPRDPAAFARARQRASKRREAAEANKGIPSPYARLNQLTLELLASNGSSEETAELLQEVKEAEGWAAARKELDPVDVWLWVQTMDARTLRWLLADPDISMEDLVHGYREQFAFGASQRVRSSVMDQLGFLQEVLEGRVQEEISVLIKEEARRKESQGVPEEEDDASPSADGDGDGAGGTGDGDRLEEKEPSTSGAQGGGRASHVDVDDPRYDSEVLEWLRTILNKVRTLCDQLQRPMNSSGANGTRAAEEDADNAQGVGKASTQARDNGAGDGGRGSENGGGAAEAWAGAGGGAMDKRESPRSPPPVPDGWDAVMASNNPSSSSLSRQGASTEEPSRAPPSLPRGKNNPFARGSRRPFRPRSEANAAVSLRQALAHRTRQVHRNGPEHPSEETESRSSQHDRGGVDDDPIEGRSSTGGDARSSSRPRADSGLEPHSERGRTPSSVGENRSRSQQSSRGSAPNPFARSTRLASQGRRRTTVPSQDELEAAGMQVRGRNRHSVSHEGTRPASSPVHSPARKETEFHEHGMGDALPPPVVRSPDAFHDHPRPFGGKGEASEDGEGQRSAAPETAKLNSRELQAASSKAAATTGQAGGGGEAKDDDDGDDDDDEDGYIVHANNATAPPTAASTPSPAEERWTREFSRAESATSPSRPPGDGPASGNARRVESAPEATEQDRREARRQLGDAKGLSSGKARTSSRESAASSRDGKPSRSCSIL